MIVFGVFSLKILSVRESEKGLRAMRRPFWIVWSSRISPHSKCNELCHVSFTKCRLNRYFFVYWVILLWADYENIYLCLCLSMLVFVFQKYHKFGKKANVSIGIDNQVVFLSSSLYTGCRIGSRRHRQAWVQLPKHYLVRECLLFPKIVIYRLLHFHSSWPKTLRKLVLYP